MGGVTGMEAFISTLAAGLSAEAIWGAIAPVSPIMIVCVLVGIGRRLAEKNTNNLIKGKGIKTK